MDGTVLARLRRVGLLAATAIIALGIAASAALAKPHSPKGSAAIVDADAAESGLAVSSLSSPPEDAAAGDSFVLDGTVTNTGDAAAAGTVTLRLLDRGQAPRSVGTVDVAVAAGSTDSYETTVSLPPGLPDGDYALAACTPTDGEGLLKCASAADGVEIGEPEATARRAPAPVPSAEPGVCSSGGHTLSQYGDHVYPEMGNTGYTSVHSDVNLIYDAVKNRFLPGTNVVLDDLATQCLTDFSLDFERKGPKGEGELGPNMKVDGVTVNGAPATFEFVQPTYPGDPAGQDDPNPAAHQAGLDAQVSEANPLPPACAPNSEEGGGEGEVTIGDQCPANKLVITPAAPIAAGEAFTVEVEYSGRPGVHVDGDESAEGWFRSDKPVGDGSFVTTEPVGTEAWMPLNNHPSAKPTYDFDEQVTLGRTAIANGELVGFDSNPPNANFPGGSTTWHWHSPEPIASYLVESSIGGYDLSERLGGDGVLYYEAQASSLSAERKTENKAIMDTQEEIVSFQERFAGPFPFTTDGVVIGAPDASFEEEMQGKITFNGGEIEPIIFHHENFHQWFGDNVSESNYDETFFKEGLATIGESFLEAREAALAAGGLDTPAGEAAFEASLIAEFDRYYGRKGDFWTIAPSNPTAAVLFENSNTYERPGATYIALRQILGEGNFTGALRQLGEDFGGSSIEKAQLEEIFKGWLPNASDTCRTRLDTFFAEWFDTAYPAGGAPADKPQLTGPGLTPSASGTTFYDAAGPCRASVPVTVLTLSPDPVGSVYTDPTVTLSATPAAGGPAVASTTYSIDGGAPTPYTGPFTLTGTGTHTVTYFSTDAEGGVERAHVTQVAVNDPPVTAATITPSPVGGTVVGPATVSLTATDDSSGIARTEYGLDGGPLGTYTGPIAVATLGKHTIAYRSVDGAGAVEATKRLTFTVAAPTTPVICSRPRLGMRVLHPLRRRHGVAILRKGHAYRYAGKLRCGTHHLGAPKGTVVGIWTVTKGHKSYRGGAVVGKAGKIDTLLRYSGKRTVIFAYAEASGATKAKIKIATVRRHR